MILQQDEIARAVSYTGQACTVLYSIVQYCTLYCPLLCFGFIFTIPILCFFFFIYNSLSQIFNIFTHFLKVLLLVGTSPQLSKAYLRHV